LSRLFCIILFIGDGFRREICVWRRLFRFIIITHGFLKPLIDAPKSDPSELSFFVPKAELR
jgi:hypothetical protein